VVDEAAAEPDVSSLGLAGFLATGLSPHTYSTSWEDSTSSAQPGDWQSAAAAFLGGVGGATPYRAAVAAASKLLETVVLAEGPRVCGESSLPGEGEGAGEAPNWRARRRTAGGSLRPEVIVFFLFRSHMTSCFTCFAAVACTLAGISGKAQPKPPCRTDSVGYWVKARRSLKKISCCSATWSSGPANMSIATCRKFARQTLATDATVASLRPRGRMGCMAWGGMRPEGKLNACSSLCNPCALHQHRHTHARETFRTLQSAFTRMRARRPLACASVLTNVPNMLKKRP